MRRGALDGDWDKAIEHLGRLPTLATRNLNRATARNAITLRDKIKAGIYKGRPGAIRPLKKVTIQVKGSDRPLVDYGDLVKGVDIDKLTPGLYFVGWKRGVRNRTGVEIVQIARILTYGKTIVPVKAKALIIPLSRKAQNAVRKAGSVRRIPGIFRLPGTKLLGKSKGDKEFEPWFVIVTKVVIPPRDYITPGIRQAKPPCFNRWRGAMRATMMNREYQAT